MEAPLSASHQMKNTNAIKNDQFFRYIINWNLNSSFYHKFCWDKTQNELGICANQQRALLLVGDKEPGVTQDGSYLDWPELIWPKARLAEIQSNILGLKLNDLVWF
jgi:hypothetical protein